MVRCQCIKKTDKKQCTRKGSVKAIHDHKFCWQHQKCLKMVQLVEPKLPTTLKKKVEKLFLEPFIQNSDQIIVFDPNMGSNAMTNTDQSTIIDNVVGGLWDTNIVSVKDSHVIQLEIFSHDIKTDYCNWEYEGIVKTELGWVGLFDYKALSKKNLTEITKENKPMNRFRYGVYVDVGQTGEFEVNVCHDAKGKVVAIKITF